MSELPESMQRLRRGRVTASEAAAIAEPGSHPYATRLSVYSRLRTGRETAVSDPFSVRMGELLEPVIVRAVSESYGVRLTHYRRTWARAEIAASPDAGSKRHELLAELKTRAYPPDDPIGWHRWQVIAQLHAVPWAQRAWLVYLCGSRLVRFVIAREDVIAELEQLEASVSAFMAEHVRLGIPPEPDLEADPADLILEIPELPAGMVRATGPALDLGSEYASAVAVRKTAEAEEKPLRAQLVAAVAELGCEQLIGPGWLAQVTTTQDGRRSLRVRVDSQEG